MLLSLEGHFYQENTPLLQEETPAQSSCAFRPTGAIRFPGTVTQIPAKQPLPHTAALR